MTYRELLEKLKAFPDHYLDDTVKIDVPIGNTDDYEAELDIDDVYCFCGVSIRTDVLWPQNYELR